MMKKPDRNFDSLVSRFERSISGTKKGDRRLQLLMEDLTALHAKSPALTVWDAGCGLAQISRWLASSGHHVTLCDISGEMLARAAQYFSEIGAQGEFLHDGAQALAPKLPEFDLVLFHAVLEWLGDPIEALAIVAGKVKVGGYLSLMFYNRNAMVYTNALKGSWRLKHLLTNSYIGKGKRLTPPNPQYPHEIHKLLSDWGFAIEAHTGIRVFQDYLPKNVLAESSLEELEELEQRYCRVPTYRDMGRYVHFLARRTLDGNKEQSYLEL